MRRAWTWRVSIDMVDKGRCIKQGQAQHGGLGREHADLQKGGQGQQWAAQQTVEEGSCMTVAVDKRSNCYSRKVQKIKPLTL